MDSSPTQDSSRGDRALEAWEEAQLATHLDMYDALALSGCDELVEPSVPSPFLSSSLLKDYYEADSRHSQPESRTP